MNKLTLDKAIIIAKESSEDQCMGDRGREDYKQLAAWLEELKRYKNKECEISAGEMFEELGFRKCDGVYREGETLLYEKTICDGRDVLYVRFLHGMVRVTEKEFNLLCAFKGEPGNKSISWYKALSDVKKQGFFKNGPADVAINEILRNCEVI